MSILKSHVPIIEYLDVIEGPRSPVKVRLKTSNGEIVHATNQQFRDMTDARRSIQDLQETLNGGKVEGVLTITERIATRTMKEKRIKKVAKPCP